VTDVRKALLAQIDEEAVKADCSIRAALPVILGCRSHAGTLPAWQTALFLPFSSVRMKISDCLNCGN
jgi:hypothetical protein